VRLRTVELDGGRVTAGARVEGGGPLLRPAKIVAIGLNYADHAREAGIELPAEPLVFAKFPSSVIGPDEDIVIDRSLTQRVDWEVELAVVIGQRLRHETPQSALRGVSGTRSRTTSRPVTCSSATDSGYEARASIRSAHWGRRS
jgi:2-keto-4-pentenoate hydratase/2-oxohepta-3-ene-1,7-dioic acid hydratase in catechol pathway